jgi:hypothetical protein
VYTTTASSVSDTGLDGITSKYVTKTNTNELAMRTLTISCTSSPLILPRNLFVIIYDYLGKKQPQNDISSRFMENKGDHQSLRRYLSRMISPLIILIMNRNHIINPIVFQKVHFS